MVLCLKSLFGFMALNWLLAIFMIWELSKSKIVGGKILVPLQLITLQKKPNIFCTHIS